MAAKPKVVVNLVIEAGNVIQEPPVFRCHPDDKVVFVLFNDDPGIHWVSVSAADILLKEDLTPAAPWVAGTHAAKLNPGEIDVIKAHKVKDASQFGKTKPLTYTTYKYTVVWADNQALTVNRRILDPDFDVTP